MPDTAKSDTLSLSGFLHFLFDGLEGYIYAPTLDRESGEFRQVFVKTSNLERLEKHLKDSAQDTDVYLAPAVFSDAKVSKQTFVASNVVWCEFDGNAPDSYEGPDPSLRILSSIAGHEHHYFRLDESITDYSILEEINRGLAFTLEADKSGWDCTQILRPPETHNYKRDKPVGIVEVTGTIHNIGAFTEFKAPPRMDDAKISLKQIPDVMDVIYKYAFPDDFRSVFAANPPEGSRSTYMMRVGYYAAEAGATDEEIYSLIFNFDERVGKFIQRADRHRRLVDIIERVRVKYPSASDRDAEADSFDPIEVFDIISFGHQTLEVDWLIPSLLQQQGNMMLVGPPGVGKTQVALNFAYGLATGTEILNYSVDKPRRILFVSCEMGPVDLKVFTDQMTSQFDADQQALLSENFFVFPHGEPLYLNTPTGQEQLKRMIDVLKVDGFIFDSLGSATNKSLTDEEGTKGLLDFNDRLRKEMGVFSWFIHHNRKATENNKEPSGLADVYGSQYITARATTVLSLWPLPQNVLKVRELKKRLAAQESDWYIKREAKHLRFRRATADETAVVIEKKTTPIGKATKDNGNKFNI